MVKHKNSLIERLLSYMTKADEYGYLISLTYKGETSYKSPIGGFFSIISRAIVIAYFGYQLYSVFTNSYTLNNTSFHMDLSNDTTIYTITADKFDFAISASSYSNNMTLNDNLHR